MSMDLSTLRPPKGAKHKKKRVGRGQGSGTGVTAGRGDKGQKIPFRVHVQARLRGWPNADPSAVAKTGISQSVPH